jgi:monoamine oxidase
VVTRTGTLVIGAGVAGLAAAATLLRAGEDVIVLEATDRLGGRIHTSRDFADHPVELGAEFIHGDRAATWQIIDQLGLATLHWRKDDDSLVRLETGELLTMREARQAHPEFDITRSWDLPEVDPLPNEDWHSYLVRIGFDRDQLRYVRRSFANACGESMRFLSARAILDGIRGDGNANGAGDYRLLSGYDRIIGHLAAGLDIRSDDPVTGVSWRAEHVTVSTLDGEQYQARAVIIAVPLGVLQADIIQFEPALPDVKHAALFGLRMGPVIKLIYRFAAPLLEPQFMALYSRLNPPMWWSPSAGQDSEQTVWSAFVSGDWAMELLSHGEEAALEAGLQSLRSELDRPGLQAEAARLVNWPEQPYTRGGYSFTLPGHENARAKLAAPTPPLFWAGEATGLEHSAATVHGALQSGRRAARQVLGELADGSGAATGPATANGNIGSN